MGELVGAIIGAGLLVFLVSYIFYRTFIRNELLAYLAGGTVVVLIDLLINGLEGGGMGVYMFATILLLLLTLGVDGYRKPSQKGEAPEALLAESKIGVTPVIFCAGVDCGAENFQDEKSCRECGRVL
jgi:hypothetical protein